MIDRDKDDEELTAQHRKKSRDDRKTYRCWKKTTI
jgi:hypothetical protein